MEYEARVTELMALNKNDLARMLATLEFGAEMRFELPEVLAQEPKPVVVTESEPLDPSEPDPKDPHVPSIEEQTAEDIPATRQSAIQGDESAETIAPQMIETPAASE